MATSRDYHDALRLCSEVAEEEYRHANTALERVKVLLRNLQRSTDAIATPAAVLHDGPETSKARSRLAELTQRLNDEIAKSIDSVKESLTRKQARLSKFTITLFGRTMVGKSTIREAVTRGDGQTIGKGAQRTTRDIREYEWNLLRIVDTPGIGAYDGSPDRDKALSVIDESDVILFLFSSDGIQESSFRAMKQLRSQNKPIIFVLNVRYDLTRPVFMRKFLRCPEYWLGEGAIQGHVARLRRLAADELGMRWVRIIPIHAQAAFLATQTENARSASALHRASRIDRLVGDLSYDVRRRGPVRRIRTVLDGTIVKLMDLEEMLRNQSELISRSAKDLKGKYSEIDAWIDSYESELSARLARSASELTRRVRGSVSAFVDENIERRDVRVRWNYLVRDSGIDVGMKAVLKQVLDEVRGRLAAFNRELAFDLEIGVEWNSVGPAQYNPFDMRRTLRWTSAGGAALAGVAGVAGWLGAANFWNPVGWIAGGVSIGAFALSWLFRDREKKLQRRKASVAKLLREEIDEMERRVEGEMGDWCDKNITKRVREIRSQTRELYTDMFGLAQALWTSADSCIKELDALNRRLLVRCGMFVGEQSAGERIDSIARDPGVRTKFTWVDGDDDTVFCREVGKALDEWIDGVCAAPQRKMVASALTPARVSPETVYFDNSRTRAIVPLPQSDMGLAIGKHGNNVKLASRLLKIPIYVVDQRRWAASLSIRRRA